MYIRNQWYKDNEETIIMNLALSMIGYSNLYKGYVHNYIMTGLTKWKGHNVQNNNNNNNNNKSERTSDLEIKAWE